MQKRFLNFVSALVSLLCLSASPNAYAKEYQEGQAWHYKTRAGEEQSNLYIVKIESLKGGQKVFHIYVDGLKIKNAKSPSGFQEEMPHLPVSKETLDKSVIGLAATTDKYKMSDIEGGYTVWRNAYDAGEAGIFNIPLAEILNIVEGVTHQQ